MRMREVRLYFVVAIFDYDPPVEPEIFNHDALNRCILSDNTQYSLLLLVPA
jgi:hypothetical protein